MENPQFYAFAGLFILLLVLLNSLITRDIHNWIPSIQKRVGLFLLVWLLPVLGFLLANKIGKLGWFKRESPQGGQSVIGRGFMEADSVLNPGVRHQIEMMDKQQSEIHYEDKQAGDSDSNTTRKSPE